MLYAALIVVAYAISIFICKFMGHLHIFHGLCFHKCIWLNLTINSAVFKICRWLNCLFEESERSVIEITIFLGSSCCDAQCDDLCQMLNGSR